MPCRDWDGVQDSQEERQLRNEVDAQQRRLDKLTRILCEVEKHIPVLTFPELSKEAQDWIQKHREDDARAKEVEERAAQLRREQQLQQAKENKLKKSALSKLTEEEREALGV
jgi:hypothetical protein